MIRPHHFLPNPQTLTDNSFQSLELPAAPEVITKMAYLEINQAKATLESHGTKVHWFENKSRQTPDSVFPNNWFSTHSGGHI